ncbi:MAG: DUF2922 domain-containing protein, partial [Peptostreptococcaceae bacterium]
MNTEVKLLMTFTTKSGKKVSLFVSDPRNNITEAEIKAAMDVIVEKNIFLPSGEEINAALEA